LRIADLSPQQFMAIRNPDADFFAALADLGASNLDDNCAKARLEKIRDRLK